MTEIHQTACPLDCPDSCSLEVRVENGRVTKLEGTTANPLTQGFLCSKVRRFGSHLYGEDRLLWVPAWSPSRPRQLRTQSGGAESQAASSSRSSAFAAVSAPSAPAAR